MVVVDGWLDDCSRNFDSPPLETNPNCSRNFHSLPLNSTAPRDQLNRPSRPIQMAMKSLKPRNRKTHTPNQNTNDNQQKLQQKDISQSKSWIFWCNFRFLILLGIEYRSHQIILLGIEYRSHQIIILLGIEYRSHQIIIDDRTFWN